MQAATGDLREVQVGTKHTQRGPASFAAPWGGLDTGPQGREVLVGLLA